jgi:hypothetical protein
LRGLKIPKLIIARIAISTINFFGIISKLTVDDAFLKVFHYGKYSALSFHQGLNYLQEN